MRRGESEREKEKKEVTGKGKDTLTAGVSSRPGPSFSIPQSSLEQDATQEVLFAPCILVELQLSSNNLGQW